MIPEFFANTATKTIKPIFTLAAIFTTGIASAFPTDGLTAYYPFDGNFANTATGEDAATIDEPANHGASFREDRFGSEKSSIYFNGDSSYLEIPDNDAFSIVTTGALTVSVWVSPEVLTFRNAEQAGYVHWMGKGVPHQHEWVFRMYNKELTSGQENRPNRMSAYAFNLEGGLGAGSYVQEEVSENEWIHFVARYDVASNKITLFKNARQKDQDDLFDATYGVQVQNGTAPLRIGTRSLWSFFQGRIDDLRFYNRALTDAEIEELYREENSPKSSTSTSAETSSSSMASPESHATTGDSSDSGSSSIVNPASSASAAAIRKKTRVEPPTPKNVKHYDLMGRTVPKR